MEELKDSYYEYVAKVPNGLNTIIELLAEDQLGQALENIINLAEGLEYLLKIEESLAGDNIIINSRIIEAKDVLNEMNESLQNQDYILLKDLMEYELVPLFSSATEWIFSVKGE